jgi:CDP-2,3-bis-(O-geranylgeranyl)-sn-glycerol synthase
MEAWWGTVIPLWQPLLLLLVANGAPILAHFILGDRYAAALDGGRRFIDGRPLLGPTKSWRGLVAALVLTTLLALLLGMKWWLGVLFALFSMLGDLLASFIKRRLALAPQGRAPGLDQVPEALLPLWLLHETLGLSGIQVMLTITLFFLLEVVISPLLYRWHIRLRPY